MSLQTMQQRGSNAYVARARAEGTGRATITAGLRDRFRGESWADLNRAIDAGTRAWEAGKTLQERPDTGRVPAAEVPRGGTDRTGFRYYTVLEFSGGEPGRQLGRSHEVYSPVNLTHGALVARAKEEGQRYIGRQPGGTSDEAIPEGSTITKVYVIAVQRD